MSNNPNHCNTRGSAGHYERQSGKGRADFIAQRLAQVDWWRERLITACNAGDEKGAREAQDAIRSIYAEHPEVVAELDAELLKRAAH